MTLNEVTQYRPFRFKERHEPIDRHIYWKGDTIGSHTKVYEYENHLPTQKNYIWMPNDIKILPVAFHSPRQLW